MGGQLRVTVALTAWLSGAAAVAGEVCLKDGRCLDAASFECVEISHSSFIEGVCYRQMDRSLIINLRGSWYRYCGVDADLAAEVISAESPGAVYNSKIKARATGGRYSCADG